MLAIAVVAVELAVDFLDSLPLHGHAVPVGGIPGHGRRRAGVHRRDIDRQLLNYRRCVITGSDEQKRRCSSWPISPTRIWRRCRFPDPRELLSKRGLGYLNWLRKRRSHPSRRYAGRAGRRPQGARARPHRGDRRSRQPVADQRVCAGAAPGSKALGDPRDVTLVPGNHDCLCANRPPDFAGTPLGRLHARRRAARAFPSCAGAGRWR